MGAVDLRPVGPRERHERQHASRKAREGSVRIFVCKDQEDLSTAAGKPVLVLAVFAGGLATGIKWHAGMVASRDLAAQQQAAKEQARRLDRAGDIEGAKDEQIRDVNTRLADALERLRQRPERIKRVAAACAGTTGAELSGPDAGFLEREAARADRLRSALQACYDQYDAMRQP